eukprot:gene2622-biopygen1115
MKYRLPIAALSLILVTGISCTYLKVRVLNADVLTTELRAWFVQNPEDRPYPPVIGVTRYDRSLVAGPLGNVLVPHARKVVYPLVSEPRMPFDALIQRLRHFPRAERHAKLFSVVHSYGFMTFHFMYEIVPKIAEGIALLRADPEVKLLVWKNDTTWIQTLFDLPAHRIVQYDHHTVYHADELFVPSPGHTGYTNPEMVRAVLAHLPARVENDRPYVIYVSRGSSSNRRMLNEHELIEALRHASPYPLVVFTDRETPTQIIALFRGAAAVLSRALGMRYWLVPVPQSWWMQPLVTSPVGQVVATLIAALEAPTPCPSGFSSKSDQDSRLGQEYRGEIDDPGESSSLRKDKSASFCSGCGAGRMGDGASCWPCAPGWFAPDPEANPTCRICPLNTFAAAEAARCVSCPSGTGTVLPGGRSAEDCVDVAHAISYRTELNGIIDIVLKMTPRSSSPPDTRLALTEWEWTVFKDSVRAEIAKSLDVPNELVSITGIRPGSVVVDVTVRYANEPPATENIVFQETFKNTWGVTEGKGEVNNKKSNIWDLSSCGILTCGGIAMVMIVVTIAIAVGIRGLVLAKDRDIVAVTLQKSDDAGKELGNIKTDDKRSVLTRLIALMAFWGVLGDFLSGVLIATFAIYRIGDTIQVKDVIGIVVDFRLLHTVVRDFHTYAYITIPNNTIYNNVTTNLSLATNKWMHVNVKLTNVSRGGGKDDVPDVSFVRRIIINDLLNPTKKENYPDVDFTRIKPDILGKYK